MSYAVPPFVPKSKNLVWSKHSLNAAPCCGRRKRKRQNRKENQPHQHCCAAARAVVAQEMRRRFPNMRAPNGRHAEPSSRSSKRTPRYVSRVITPESHRVELGLHSPADQRANESSEPPPFRFAFFPAGAVTNRQDIPTADSTFAPTRVHVCWLATHEICGRRHP